MKRRVTGQVVEIYASRPGAREVIVAVPDGEGQETRGRRAIDLVELTGGVVVGDSVVLNTVAVELGLGTGGLDFVVAVLRDEEPDLPVPGHIMKLRYTPMQLPVLAVEAPESRHHKAIQEFQSLDGLPVVCAQLHSQIPGIVAGARWAWRQTGRPGAPRIAYIMTEGAALPLALSRLVATLREREWLAATITAGQAFGGEHECVNLYSALATASAVVDADLVIVCQGPGNVGTDTPLGFSGIEQGVAINAVASLCGSAVAVARISFGEERERHRGISHHTLTVLERVALSSALVPLPKLDPEQMAMVELALAATTISDRHTLVTVDAGAALADLVESGLSVRTMGRRVDAEQAFFLATCAAGIVAVHTAVQRNTLRS